MLKIIKAEYSYLMYGSIHSLLIIVSLVLFYKIIDVVILNRVTFMIGILLLAHLIGSRKKEQRSYKEIVLPLQIKTLALTRLVMTALPILILYIISIGLNIYFLGFHTAWNDSIFELISMCLISILFSFAYYFLTDIFSVFQTKKGRIIFEAVVGLIIMAAALLTIITTEKSYSSSIFSGITINIFELLGIIFFSFVTVYTFKQKESHIL
jgi:hypothetical protein